MYVGGRGKERGRREEGGRGGKKEKERGGWGTVPNINMKMCLTCILHIAVFPGPSPASCRLQYSKHTASDRKLGEGLGTSTQIGYQDINS